MEKIWDIKFDGRNLSSNEIVDQVLRGRGIKNVDEFLNPSASNLIDFKAFKNIDKAKDIVLNTLDSAGEFLIYGDVDTDGCSSAAIMYRYLKHFTNKIKIYLNVGKVHGITDDFDFDKQLSGINTVIVVDSMNDNPTKYIEILKRGINLIILDHHIPSKEILDISDKICLISSAIDNYPNPNLSGSGVTWKFTKYLDLCLNSTYSDDLVDLATTGIVGDICDVSEKSMENRYICNLGFNNLKNPGIKKILGSYEFNSTAILYSISPLVNGANRLENNYDAVNLFITDDELTLSDTVQLLTDYKIHQKGKVDALYHTFIDKQVLKQINNKCMYFMIDADKNFAGLLANKVCGEFCRPVIVLYNGEDDRYYNGSMRATGIDDFRAIINSTGIGVCEGHEQAAGVTIPKDKFFDFYDKIEYLLKDYTFVQKVDVDVQISVPQISSYLVSKIKAINKITGNGFPQVLVAVTNVTDYSVREMSGGKHMAIDCANNVSFIKWNILDWGSVDSGKSVSVIGTLDESFRHGKWHETIKTSQIILTDYKFE